jgi:hypothetical protein
LSSPDGALLKEFVAFLAVGIFLPDALVLLPPTAHQVTTHKNISAAGIAGNIVASTNIEQSYLVAVTALDVAETLAQVKIAQESV